jgi:hypothetical protein
MTWHDDIMVDCFCMKQVKYFDTIAPTASMCVLKTGFLFAASEFGNHYLFQFTGIGIPLPIFASLSCWLV